MKDGWAGAPSSQEQEPMLVSHCPIMGGQELMEPIPLKDG